jgi:dTDP-glucose 4,6-dehydratase
VLSNCSNNYGPDQHAEKLIPLMIENIINQKPLPVYGKGENIRDWLFVKDHAEAIDLILHRGKLGETYAIGGNNELRNIDIVYRLIDVIDRILGRKEGTSQGLIRFVTDRLGHDFRYAIDASKIEKNLGWKAKTSFEEGLEYTVRSYLKK